MTYVLGVSAALCWVLPRPASPQAVQLRDESRRGGRALIAPSVFAAEAASALTKAERQKLIPVGQAGILLADILSTPPTVHPYEPGARSTSPRNPALVCRTACTRPWPNGKDASW